MNQRDLQRLRRARRINEPVVIEWLDSMGYRGGWLQRSEIEDGLPTMRSIGWIVALQEDVKVCIAGHVDTQNDNFNGTVDIPLLAVTGVWAVVS